MTAAPLCRVRDIIENGSLGCTAKVSGKDIGLIVVRKGGDVFVYVNACPHNRGPLDFTPGQFLNLQKNMILCSSHGAQFRLEDGHCVSGPCAGQDLQAIACTVRDGFVWLD